MAALNAALAPFVRHDGKGEARLELAVKGVRCANCIAKIESGLMHLDGVTAARLNLSTGKLGVAWRENRLSPEAIVSRVTELGYDARPYDPQTLLANEDEEGGFLLRCLAVAGFGTAFVAGLTDTVWYGGGDMGPGTRTLFYWIAAAVAVPVALYSGRPFFRSALKGLSGGTANMDVPISLAIVLALALSLYQTAIGGAQTYFDAAVMLPFLLLIGRYLDHLLRRKARSAAHDLIAMQTVTATRLNADGHTQAVLAREIAIGDRLLLSTGERAPVDGVLENESEAGLSLVTGESMPVMMRKGETLHAGSIITGAASIMRATARVEDSLVAELARLLETGQQAKSRYVKLADRAAFFYVPLVHFFAATVFMVWFTLLNASFSLSLQNAIALLIVTCPCALGLAVPAVQIVATGRLFRRGLLVKSGDALERLAEIDMAIFDKTGTLTLGHPVLLNADKIDAKILERAARLARTSNHPLARALASAAGIGPITSNAHEVPGCGIEANENNIRLRLGRADWIGVPPGDTSELCYAEGSEPVVRFAFEDALKPDAASTLTALQKLGIPCEMLSGDRSGAAAHIAGQAGLAQWRAAVTAQDKAAYLETLRAQGYRVLMVGDGLNDAAALALAHVSISPGSAVDATQAAADMVLRGEQLMPIAEALQIARKARARVLENFAFAAAYNILAVPLTAFGLVTPLIAAIAMASSSLIVTLNALRLKA